MRAKRSSTAASSRATESLQLQAAAHPVRSSRTFTHKPAKPRNSATTKPPSRERHGLQQVKTGVHIHRRSGYWQPTGWDKRTSAKSMASTSFCGGLETINRHCPATKCSQALSPAQAEVGGGNSWLRWDHNPVWAVPDSTEGVVLLGPPPPRAPPVKCENRHTAADTAEPTCGPVLGTTLDGSSDLRLCKGSSPAITPLVEAPPDA